MLTHQQACLQEIRRRMDERAARIESLENALNDALYRLGQEDRDGYHREFINAARLVLDGLWTKPDTGFASQAAADDFDLRR